MRTKPWIIVVLHVLCWLLYLSLPFMFRQSHTGGGHHGPESIPPPHRGDMSYLSIMTNGLLIPLFYLNLNYVLPVFFNKKRFGLFWLWQLGLFAIYYFAAQLLLQLVAQARHIPLFMQFFNYLVVTLVAVCYSLVSDNLERERKQKEKETEQLKSELLFLRWQISPHFLFNVLNNLVALARTKSDKMEPMILRLSTLMRYMLYETDERKVGIYKEADYLQSYISLQSLRFGDAVVIHTNIDIPEQTPYVIEPMLLIPYVENAFKHGTGLIENPVIDVDMKLDGSTLLFDVRNKYMPIPEDSKDETHGVGLTNVQRRLNLLYGDKYKLNVRIADGWFVASLKINLS